MFRHFIRLFVLLALAITCGGKVSAAESSEIPFPTKVFDASYKASADGELVRVASNGTGKVIMTSNQEKVRYIFDIKGKTKYSIVDDEKACVKSPLKEVPEIINDAHTLKLGKMHEAGAKEVEGHSCHGYNVEQGPASLTVWLADDIGIIVKEEVELKVPSMPTKHFDLVMAKWAATSPSDSELTVPADYKQSDANE